MLLLDTAPARAREGEGHRPRVRGGREPRDRRDHRGPVPVLASNVLAIPGLRARYFRPAGMITIFTYQTPALIAVLAFVGTKMLLVKTPYEVDTLLSLAVVLTILLLGVGASVVAARRSGERAAAA